MRRCNPMWVFSIYTCVRHKNSNTRTATKNTNTSRFHHICCSPPRLLHPIHQRASAIGRAGLWNHRPQRSCTGRGRIRFLGSDLHDCSLTSSSSSPRLVYLFVGRAPRVIAFNANFVRLKESQVMYDSCSQIMSYIFNMLICIDMILLDNLL
jgi:hypothetical protein